MATLSSAELSDQRGVVNNLKHGAAAAARLRQSPTADAEGDILGARVGVSLPPA